MVQHIFLTRTRALDFECVIKATMTVSTRTLNILAAVVWYSGGVVLLVKGSSLLLEARQLGPGLSGPYIGLFAGLAIGALKARYLFSRSCERNLDRIAALTEPKLWQFHRMWFNVVLLIVSYTGATLSKMAHGNYIFLILMGAMDLTIAVALLGGSYVFWRRRAFSKGLTAA